LMDIRTLMPKSYPIREYPKSTNDLFKSE
jgi:hypothetical protein